MGKKGNPIKNERMDEISQAGVGGEKKKQNTKITTLNFPLPVSAMSHIHDRNCPKKDVG